MSSILRSSKFVRYFVGLARNIVLNTPREVDGSLVQRSQCLACTVSNNYATIATQNQKPSLDQSIKRLDDDARRIGRISRREIEEVLEEIQQSKRATSSQSLMVIRCCGNLVPEEAPQLRTELVKQVWNTLEKLGVPMDISHYNALLRVYLENEHRFSPTQFLTELETKGVEPNRVTYQRLIAGFCQQGDIAGATHILEFMREKQLPVSENVFNALILGHSQADDMESAHGILGVMKQAGLEPSNESYTTLMCGYAKKGDMAAIEKLMEESESKDVFLTDKDILEVVFTLGVNKHPELVDKVLPRVKHLLGYNQDAANVILRLINQGDDETAMKILKTMNLPTRMNGQTVYAGSFMIKQMVRANMPLEKIEAVCKTLQEDGLNSRSFSVAVLATFTVNNVNQTLALLKALSKNNEPVRMHYFWPVLIAAGKAGDLVGVKTVVEEMINFFNLPPNGETIKEYILPYLKNKTPDTIMRLFLEAGMKRGTAAGAVIGNLIAKNKLKEAANLALQNVDINFLLAFNIRALVSSFVVTKDLDSFVILVRALVNSVNKNKTMIQNVEEEEEPSETGDIGLEKEEVVGSCVIELAKRNSPDFARVLKEFLDQGLTINNSSAQLAENSLNCENLTEEVSALLAKLASGDMMVEPLKRQGVSSARMQISRNATALESLREKLISKGEPIDGILRQLLSLHCFNRDVEAANKIKDEIDASNLELTAAQYAQMLDAFVNAEKLDEVLKLYTEAKDKNHDFTLDRIKAAKLANLLIQNGQVDEAIEIMKTNINTGEKETSYVLNSICWRMLNSLAEKKNVDDVKRVLDTLVKSNYLEVTNVMLGPLIKVRLLNNDLEGALDEFERCCELYRATPWKNELMCKLIQAEDATNLQRLTDLSTQIHGEVNSLYDLVMAFVECGRIRQARKILETPGLRAREDRIKIACERFKNDGLVAPLENLIEVTKDLNHIDRSSIYYQLLLSYQKTDEVDKALGLWTKMQDEDVPVTDKFLSALGNFLKNNGRQVPFALPTNIPEPSESDKTQDTTQITPENRNRSSIRNVFISALRNNQVDSALEAKIKMDASGDVLSKSERTRLLEAVLKAERFNEASRLVRSWLPDSPPSPNVLKFYTSKLSSTGDVEAFDQYGQLLNQELQKIVSFENKRITCLLAAGKGGDELDRWEKAIDLATTQEEIDRVCTKFPRGGVLGILDKYPECIPQYEKIVDKFNDKGYNGAANTLFIYYFCHSQIDKAKAVYDKYLANSSRLMFQSIMTKARKNNDVHILTELKQMIKDSPAVTPGVVGHLCSTIINICCSEEKYDEALSQLEECLKTCSIENITPASLLKLKTGLEQNNKTFKYTIPDKKLAANKDDSTSSSSSDDEKKPAQSMQ